MKYIIDIEADGLLDTVSRIHVASIYNCETKELYSIFGRKDITDFFSSLSDNDTIIGHNFIRYDKPVIEKLCNIKLNCKIIDSLAISWYLYPQEDSHGLEQYGYKYSVPKPKILDWKNLSKEDYQIRCETDVEINRLLWEDMEEYLYKLYPDSTDLNRFLNYISFKIECAERQERFGWRLNIDLCRKELNKLEVLRDEKIDILKSVMPTVVKTKELNKPKSMFTKDGNLSVRGLQWKTVCSKYNFDEDSEVITYPCGEEQANPTSVSQVKDWLFSLGWKPATFIFRKNSKGQEKKVEQLTDSNKDLCPSILLLAENKPEIKHLDGLYTINNRIGILKGFLEEVSKDGFLQAKIRGLTNTLRFKHAKPLVNLPKHDADYAESIRECLIAPNDKYVLCGADVSGLEDTSKRNYIYQFDPEYVKSQLADDFDAHLSVAELAGILTAEQVEEHKKGIKKYNKERQLAKIVNFAGVYGAGPAKIAASAGITLDLAKKLHTAYWDLNWSVKKVSSLFKVITVNNQMWLYNPISKFYYSLRYEKDKFSTGNQGLGVYYFDTWLYFVYQEIGEIYPQIGQFHDEGIWVVPRGKQDQFKEILNNSISKVNKKLNLIVPLKIDIKFGVNYKEIH